MRKLNRPVAQQAEGFWYHFMLASTVLLWLILLFLIVTLNTGELRRRALKNLYYEYQAEFDAIYAEHHTALPEEGRF